MNPKFESKFKSLETKREAIFARLKSATSADLMRSPGPQRWSAVQALQHLVIAERGTNMYLQKKVLGKDQVKQSGLVNTLRMVVGKLAFSIPMKFKAPNVVADPPANITLEETEKQWAEVRQNFYSIVKALEEQDLTKELFKHPIMGRLDIFQTIDFFEIHMDRHAEQAYRTLEEVRKKA